MEKWKKRSIDLVTSLAFGSKGDPTVVAYYPQKTKISLPEERFFRRSTPEKHGISSKRLYNMLCELEGERRANMHNLMVLCGGEVICDCSADGYDVNTWHISHSMSKTVCGMVIGTLVDEGRLHVDEKLIDLFPEIQYKDKKFPQITVENLLAMTSGVDFAEVGSITEKDWSAAFFSATVRFAPGTKFAYNSMNTYILARIAERVSGRSFGELASERIFAPLGINNYFWEKGPEGTEKAGWGLYMSAESWAKMGYMFSRGSEFYGKRILSKDWVRMSSTVKAMGESVYTPDGEREFRTELIFPETASVRMLVIKPIGSDRILLRFSEVPNNRMVENMLARYSETSSTIGFAVDLLERRLGEGEVASMVVNLYLVVEEDYLLNKQANHLSRFFADSRVYEFEYFRLREF